MAVDTANTSVRARLIGQIRRTRAALGIWPVIRQISPAVRSLGSCRTVTGLSPHLLLRLWLVNHPRTVAMAKVINFNRARKRKAKEEERKVAQANALRHGRTKLDRNKVEHERALADRRLDGKRLDVRDGAVAPADGRSARVQPECEVPSTVVFLPTAKQRSVTTNQEPEG